MLKWIVLVVLLSFSVHAQTILITTAHQDDESIGASGLLQRHMNDTTHLIVFTDGAPDEKNHTLELFELRRKELLNALSYVSMNETDVQFLMYDDSNFIADIGVDGTYNAILNLKEQIEILKPDIIYTHAYEHGHIDHDTVHYITVKAIELSEHQARTYEFFEYNPITWFNGTLPEEIAREYYYSSPIIFLNMTYEEMDIKKNMVLSYPSQEPICNKDMDKECEDALLKRYYKGTDQYREIIPYEYTLSPCKKESCRYEDETFYRVVESVNKKLRPSFLERLWNFFKSINS
tara:strand:- start:151 stop:1023 length:873 start_codon:yes stop_codon:yes gene_type:complete